MLAAGGFGIPIETSQEAGLKRLRRTALASLAGMVLVLGGCSSSGVPFNATPAITNLYPSNITAGSQPFTLFVVGTGFIADSKGVTFAYWNGSPRSTTLNVTTGQLEVQILASDVAGPATTVASVTVVNPGPGGGESLPSTFTIEAQQNTAPIINGAPPLSPPNAKAGGAAFTLTVNGANFAVNDPVTWNGSVRSTTFVNANQVTAAISANDIATAGFASVAVYTPNLLVGSPSINFSITGASNPVPGISSLSPSSATHGASDLEVTVSGSGFVQGSVVEWGNTPLATAYMSSSQLVALVPAAELAASGTVKVGVTNPAPGGGTSTGTETFTIN